VLPNVAEAVAEIHIRTSPFSFSSLALIGCVMAS
jgi:hypothetical protein